MRLHLVGFPHTRVDPKFSTCAYTQKIAKFARMGWDDLIVYATEGSDVGDATLVPCLTEDQRIATFGRDNFKKPPEWPTDEQWSAFNSRAAIEVANRSQPGDLLLLQGGWSQHVISEANPHLIACEPGVGYEGIFTPFCAFESYAWQHFIYGKRNLDGRWFDAVIPNYFDVDEFPIVNQSGGQDGEYLLFVGRVVQRKGLQAAMDIATAAKMPLKVAGPGPTKWRKGKHVTAPEVTIKGCVEYLGVLGVKERNEVMAKAAAVLVPTVYVEPFGGVAVEAMFSGTPVIATDWGAFTETVVPGTGYRFRTLQQAADAVRDVKAGCLESGVIRSHAEDNYSLNAVKPQFEEWFDGLNSLNRKGWYELR